MFVSLDNDPRPYDWGSMTDIAELLGRKPSGRPEAELWLGDHPGCPARIVNPAAVGGHRTLADWTTAEPEAALGTASGGRLPFLLKVLAAATPLSLQVHPTIEQAQAGFEQEDNAGISFDAPHRNYRDANHKPELIVALSDSFEALCGFRAIEESREIAARLVELARDTGVSRTGLSELASLLKSSESPEAAVKWLLGENPVVAELTALVESGLVPSGLPDHPEVLPLVARLALQYPEDPGIAVALLVNQVTIRRGDALYLPAGNIHAYLGGLGIELMSASDNVLRGGLTRKHVDVTELLSVLDFTPSPVPHLRATVLSPGVEEFAPGVSDFRLLRVRLGTTGSGTSASRVGIAGPAIILAVAGEATVAGCVSSATIARGQSLYVTPDESVLELSGSGDFFIATTGEQHPECWEDTERVETTTTTIVADRRADLDSAIDAAVAEAIGVARTEGRRGIRVTRQNDRQVTVELTAAVPFGLTHVEDLRGLL